MSEANREPEKQPEQAKPPEPPPMLNYARPPSHYGRPRYVQPAGPGFLLGFLLGVLVLVAGVAFVIRAGGAYGPGGAASVALPAGLLAWTIYYRVRYGNRHFLLGAICGLSILLLPAALLVGLCFMR